MRRGEGLHIRAAKKSDTTRRKEPSPQELSISRAERRCERVRESFLASIHPSPAACFFFFLLYRDKDGAREVREPRIERHWIYTEARSGRAGIIRHFRCVYYCLHHHHYHHVVIQETVENGGGLDHSIAGFYRLSTNCRMHGSLLSLSCQFIYCFFFQYTCILDFHHS